MKRVGYQTVYLWTCPDCGALWQLRKRPRAGRDVACAPSGEQTQILPRAWTGAGKRGHEAVPCGAVNTSKGERQGVPPTLYV